MAELPTGIVTFLFTDIEDSTALLEQHPEAMPDVLERHDAVLRGAVERHGGIIFKTLGDGFCTVFTDPRGALHAALDGQQGLQGEDWGAVGALRVRIALNTGPAELRRGEYFGLTLNRCDRLRDIAHGSQTLLSQSAADAVRAALPEGVSLRSMGLHRLRGLRQPERVFQLLHPTLTADFPDLRSLALRPYNLPEPLTSFVNREREITAITELLTRPGVRLVTLTGIGGCGKTRLAQEVATHVIDRFPGGAWYVPLADVADPDHVPAQVAAALGLRPNPGEDCFAGVAAFLQRPGSLLVFDNFEHLLPAAPFVTRLLETARTVRCLVTSRETLSLAAEYEFAVTPFPPPPTDAPLERLAREGSVRLFVERACRARLDFALDEANARPVAEICARLDGIPLALELAAAQVRSMTVPDLHRHLRDRKFEILVSAHRDASARQQTMRQSLGWSYDLLTEPERRVAVELAVFTGGFYLDAAEAVCVEEPVAEIVPRLVEQSLLTPREVRGRIRFAMLQVVREYILERLGERIGEVQRRHTEYFSWMAEQFYQQMISGDRAEALQAAAVETDNLRAALRWALNAQEHELVTRFVTRLWLGIGLWSEYLALAPALRRSLRAIGDRSGEARLLDICASIAHRRGEHAEAYRGRREALEICLELDDERLVVTLTNLASSAAALDRCDEALRYCDESLRLARGSGNDEIVAHSLWVQADVALRRGETATARSLGEEARAAATRSGDTNGVADAVRLLGAVAQAEGARGDAHQCFLDALQIYRSLGSRFGITLALFGLGMLHRSDDPTAAAALLALTARLEAELGAGHLAETQRTLDELAPHRAGSGASPGKRPRSFDEELDAALASLRTRV